MNNLNSVISSLSKDDYIQFKAFLEKKNKRGDAKNIKLLKILRQNNLDTKTICQQLYATTSCDAYHALRKRLFKSIIHFSANASINNENSSEMEVIKYLLAARNFLQQKQFNIAYTILNRAEHMAIEYHMFPLLNEIYNTKIQFAYAYPSTNLNVLLQKLNTNKAKHTQEDQLNILYSTLKYKLAHGDRLDFKTMLHNTLQDVNLDILNTLSFKSLYQIISIITVSAFASNSYLKIEDFLTTTYTSILNYKNKEKQPYYHIQILYHLANVSFRNKKFDASLRYLEKMLALLHSYKEKYYNTFNLKYHLLLSLNYNFSNRQDNAITVLEPFTKVKHPDIETVLDMHLSLIMFYFQKEKLKKAQQLSTALYHSDNWYTTKVGAEWVIKKNLIEILLYIDLGYTDLVYSKLQSFKRRYSTYLKNIEQIRVITYLNLVEDYFKNPYQITSTEFKQKVEASFKWLNHKEEDIFVMSFYAWLKAKMEKTSLYKSTMNLINHTQLQQ